MIALGEHMTGEHWSNDSRFLSERWRLRNLVGRNNILVNLWTERRYSEVGVLWSNV